MLFKFFMIIFLCLGVAASAKPGFYEPWGKDADLLPAKPSDFPPMRKDIISKFAERLILFNQNVISPTYGPRSHFRPTSSRYTLLSMRRYGFIKGFIMGCDRLMRENGDPWVYRTVVIDGITYKWDPTFGKN